MSRGPSDESRSPWAQARCIATSRMPLSSSRLIFPFSSLPDSRHICFNFITKLYVSRKALLDHSCPWFFQHVDLPNSSAVKNLSINAGNIGSPGLISGSGRSPGGGHGNLLHYSCLQNAMDRGAWQGHSPWGHKESDMIEHICTPLMKVTEAQKCGFIPGSGEYPGEENGYLFQHSCLENYMNRGAWWATYTPWGHKVSDMSEHTHK